jgi:hypothetical protein
MKKCRANPNQGLGDRRRPLSGFAGTCVNFRKITHKILAVAAR